MTVTTEPRPSIPTLAPELPNRIVWGISKDITTTDARALKGKSIVFKLEQALQSVPEKSYIEVSSIDVPLGTSKEGIWFARLPVAVDTIEPVGKWAITVAYGTRPAPFSIVVPPGDEPINIADIAQAFPIDEGQASWLLTGLQRGTITLGGVGEFDVRFRGSAPTMLVDMTIPQGKQGDPGPTGPANVLALGTVSTGPAGSQASAAITGTAPSQSLALTVPRGDKGDKGDRGDVGAGLKVLGTKANTGALPASGALGDGWLIGTDMHVWNGTAWQNVGPVRGPQGDVGKTPQIAATAQTLAAGAAATVAVGGTADAPAFTLGIPRGRDGATITKVEQTAPTTVAVTVTDPVTGPTVTTWTLPIAQTTFTEARPGVWQPTTP